MIFLDILNLIISWLDKRRESKANDKSPLNLLSYCQSSLFQYLCFTLSLALNMSLSTYIPLCPHNYYLSMYSSILSIYLPIHLSVYLACNLCMLTMIVGFMCVILALWVANPGAKNMRRKMIGKILLEKIYIFFNRNIFLLFFLVYLHLDIIKTSASK